MADLDAVGSLDANEWRGINELANALSQFEPLAKRGNLGKTVADRLVAMGLAETGAASSAFISRGMPIGYRLTELGWRVKERGRFSRTI